MCPECGTPCPNRPVTVRDGEACFFVYHDHNCSVYRYVACIDSDGEQSNRRLRKGERFEDVMGDAA